MGVAKRLIEVDDVTAVELEARAADAGISVSELLAELLTDGPVAVPPPELAELDAQLASLKAGAPTVPHAEVVRWLDSWGTPHFRRWADR